jgi:hypothetical protein
MFWAITGALYGASLERDERYDGALVETEHA